MATLEEDIHTQSEWLVKAFGSDDIMLDYTVESLKKIDLFFDVNSVSGKPTTGGRLSQNLGPVLFSIGAYVGITIIKAVPGAIWITDDKDPEGEITARIKLPNGSIIYPIIRVTNRFKNGSEDGIYAYGAVVVKELSTENYWKDRSEKQVNPIGKVEKKPWWKFW